VGAAYIGGPVSTGSRFVFTGPGALPGASELAIGTNGVGTRILSNVPTGGEFNFTVNGTTVTAINATTGLYTTGLINSTNTTASTSTTTGALIVSGGAGFAGNIHSGGTGNFNGVVTSLGGNAGVQVYDRSVGASDAWLMSATGGSNLTFVNNGNSELTVAKGGAVTARGSLRSTSATGGIGYATGAGGAVTQGTSRTTGVTLNNVAGAITLFTAAGSATWQSFTVTNSAVAATDTIIVNQRSGTDLYMMHVTAVGAGSFRISFATTGGTTSEAPVFNFAVIKAVSS
jgi:hypothetical protein